MTEAEIPLGLSDEALAQSLLAFREDLFAGQSVLISGGGSGIGRALAYAFVRLGAKVMICGRREDRLVETVTGIQRYLGKEIAYYPMTIRDPAQVGELINAAWLRFGRLDLLVNNGGGQFPQDALDFSVKGWNAVIDTNLNGTFYMMQAAARRWKQESCPGAIINIVAVVDRGIPQLSHTCAARAGVIHFSKSVAVEWAPLKIRVNCVAPGPIETTGLNVYPKAASAAMRDSTPIKRLGGVNDVVHGVAYLASPLTGGFVTGETLHIDGGRQLWGEDWPGGRPDYYRIDQPPVLP
jgi:citronellol/citronellal dehydrogenase